MIVLAIAGLIMMIVFVAIPQLRRHVRNTHRKTIANLVFADLQQYVGDNQGAFPNHTGAWGDFYTNYIGRGSLDDTDPLTAVSIFGPAPPDTSHTPDEIDPDYCLGVANIGDPCSVINSCTGSDEPYAIPCNSGKPDSGYARIVFNAKCAGEDLVSANGNGNDDVRSTQYALVMGLEPSGVTYCIDSQ